MNNNGAHTHALIKQSAARACASALVAILCVLPAAASACEQFTIGLNKFDLALQYIGRASGGNGSPAVIKVTRAMARKAITDAAHAGVSYFRIAASGFTPSDLELWTADPTEYWRSLDQMMADLRAADICVIPVLAWNPVQFPAMAGERLSDMLANPNSASWQLLERYVRDFVTRYRSSPNLMFYELMNELNNHVDIDAEGACNRKKGAAQCAAMSNFTTEEMNRFTARFAALIRRLDGSHKISSGFSLPRPAAQHLRRRPQVTGRADWTSDSQKELEETLRDIHKSVDIISVHLYAPNSARLGLHPGELHKIADIVQSAAARIGKPLFIGEFGQRDIVQAGETSFVSAMTDEIAEVRVPFSAAWVWEFYQVATDAPYQSEPSSFSLEPGYTDSLIDQIRRVNRSRRPQATSVGAQASMPEVVLTKPLECAPVEPGAELFAVASNDIHGADGVDFLMDRKEIGRVVQPPYRLVLPGWSVAGDLVELEARTCNAAGRCRSYKTQVVFGKNPEAHARCISEKEGK